jgi:hypothetical protein
MALGKQIGCRQHTRLIGWQWKAGGCYPTLLLYIFSCQPFAVYRAARRVDVDVRAARLSDPAVAFQALVT